MQSEDQFAVEHGMQQAASLPDIMPQQADQWISSIDEDMQRVLRVPMANLTFRSR